MPQATLGSQADRRIGRPRRSSLTIADALEGVNGASYFRQVLLEGSFTTLSVVRVRAGAGISIPAS